MVTPRIDSHHHLWRIDRGDYPWVGERLAPICRDFLPRDIAPELQAASVHRTVVIQAADTVEETRFLLELVERSKFVAGVVGWVNLANPVELSEFAKNPLFVGIRPMIQQIEDTAWMLRPDLDAGYRLLVDADLTFDALVRPRHLKNLLELACRYPELQIAINHCGKPEIEDEQFEDWASDILALAERQNVACKLSGIVNEAGRSPSLEKLQPYMHHILDSFGARRVMWGSDWPVVNMAGGYANWVSYVEQFLEQRDPDEREWVWGRTAARIYDLDPL